MRLKFLPSFVKRRGRITKNQEENLKFLSDFSINNIEQIRKEATHYSYCCLEIGFGNGSFLGYAASQKFNYDGVESNQNLVDLAMREQELNSAITEILIKLGG